MKNIQNLLLLLILKFQAVVICDVNTVLKRMYLMWMLFQ